MSGLELKHILPVPSYKSKCGCKGFLYHGRVPEVHISHPNDELKAPRPAMEFQGLSGFFNAET